MNPIVSMFDHIHWANLRILDTLGKYEHARAAKLFAHTLHAERVWLTRLEGQDSTALPLWTELSTAECTELVQINREGYRTFLGKLTEADYEAIVQYRNQTGKEFETKVCDILTHVALHGQYHRGQINMLLRDNGFEPVNVDFITYVR